VRATRSIYISRDLVFNRVFDVPTKVFSFLQKTRPGTYFRDISTPHACQSVLMGYIIVVQGMTGYSQLDSYTACESRDRKGDMNDSLEAGYRKDTK
jgi:hypothetical protein